MHRPDSEAVAVTRSSETPVTLVEDKGSVGVPSLDFPRLFASEFGYVFHTLRRLGIPERDLPDVTHDVFLQVHFIQIPETLPERAYTIAIGAYRTQSRQRLGILPGQGGEAIGSRLILYTVDVARNP